MIESADDRALAMIAARRRDGAFVPCAVRLPSGRVVSAAELEAWLSIMEPPAAHHVHPSGAVHVVKPAPVRPPALGVAMVLAAACALIGAGVVVAFSGPPLSGATIAAVILAAAGWGLGARVLWVWGRER